MNSMLAIGEESQLDDSIQSYKRFAYLPISGTNLNNANPIVIRVENSDNYFRPSDSGMNLKEKWSNLMVQSINQLNHFLL